MWAGEGLIYTCDISIAYCGEHYAKKFMQTHD